MLRYLIPLFVFIGLVALFVVGLRHDPRHVPSPLINKPAPDFQLPRLEETDASIGRADLMGEVVLLNVWASWCVQCRHEHPLLVDLAKTGVVNLVGLNYKDTRKEAIAWLDYFGDPYSTSAFDEDGRVGIDYGVYGVPETFILDREGIIRYKHIGPISQDALDTRILPIVRLLNAGSATGS
jgi:cytochrome c biogenesis protein CcmG/thiol:disulfide interchange protein DsbE